MKKKSYKIYAIWLFIRLRDVMEGNVFICLCMYVSLFFSYGKVEDTPSTERPHDTLAEEEEYERQQEALRKEKEQSSQGRKYIL